jgi:hypothetical protein
MHGVTMKIRREDFLEMCFRQTHVLRISGADPSEPTNADLVSYVS